MIGSTMNLLAIIIIVLALAAAGAIIYAAWELSSDKPSAGKADTDNPSAARTYDANEGETGDTFRNKQATPEKDKRPES
jgi:flagellar basal body-associated protein FliL